MSEFKISKKWTDEELDELHSHLWAFMSFIDDVSLEVIGKRQPIVVSHVRALAKMINEKIEDHGGRFYKPLKDGSES